MSRPNSSSWRTLRDYPKYVPAYCDLAELQLRQGRVPEAMQTLNDALVLAPNDPHSHQRPGHVLGHQADYARALEQFTKASELAPNDARYRAKRCHGPGHGRRI